MFIDLQVLLVLEGGTSLDAHPKPLKLGQITASTVGEELAASSEEDSGHGSISMEKSWVSHSCLLVTLVWTGHSADFSIASCLAGLSPVPDRETHLNPHGVRLVRSVIWEEEDGGFRLPASMRASAEGWTSCASPNPPRITPSQKGWRRGAKNLTFILSLEGLFFSLTLVTAHFEMPWSLQTLTQAQNTSYSLGGTYAHLFFLLRLLLAPTCPRTGRMTILSHLAHSELSVSS